MHTVRAHMCTCWVSDRALSAILFTVDCVWGRVRRQHGWPSLITRHRQNPVLFASIQNTRSRMNMHTHTHALINPKTKGKLKKTVSTFNWTDCRPTIKRKQAQSFSSILSLVELLIDGANCTRKWNGEEKRRARVCLNVVIKFDYSCVMHAVWILVTEWGGVLSFSMVTVENLYVPDEPAGILLSKYTMLRQKIINK